MDLQKFKETYNQIISESADNSKLKEYIRSIVEEIINEKNISDEQFNKLKNAVDKEFEDPTDYNLMDRLNDVCYRIAKISYDDYEKELNNRLTNK